MKESVIVDKSKAFALRVIKLYRHLCTEKQENVLSKMNIALKETDESAYWLESLHESGLLEAQAFESIYADCTELIKILVAILKTKTS